VGFENNSSDIFWDFIPWVSRLVDLGWSLDTMREVHGLKWWEERWAVHYRDGNDWRPAHEAGLFRDIPRTNYSGEESFI